MRNLSTPAGGEVDCPQHCLSFRNCLTHCSQWSFPQPGGPHATQPALQRLKGPSTDLQSLVSCSLSPSPSPSVAPCLLVFFPQIPATELKSLSPRLRDSEELLESGSPHLPAQQPGQIPRQTLGQLPGSLHPLPSGMTIPCCLLSSG